jgi:uncharacterized membrane protein
MKFRLFCTLLCIFGFLQAVTYQEYNPNDERFKLLAVQKAKLRMEQSEQDMKNARQLLDKNCISKNEYQQCESQFLNDKLNYEQYMLSVIYDKPYISVVSAFKTQKADGQIYVELMLANTSGGNYAIQQAVADEKSDQNQLHPDTMYNLYVSLQDEQRNIISQPYEYHIESLKLGANQHIRFSLLKDVESVIVSVNYGDQISEKKILLKRKGTSNTVTIAPDVYAQDVQNGETAVFHLAMEYFGDSRKNLVPEILNLPPGFTWSIVNESNNLTISNLVFSTSQAKQNYILYVTIPEKEGTNIVMDRPLPFILSLSSKDKEIAGTVDLQITPAGKAELAVTLLNLYYQINKGKSLELYPVTLENKGIKPITNISYDLSLPTNWEYKAIPAQITKLEAKQKMKIRIVIIPAENTGKGIYDMKLTVNGKNVDKPVVTPEQLVKLEIQEKGNLWLIIGSVLLAMAFVAGLVYGMIRISKN